MLLSILKKKSQCHFGKPALTLLGIYMQLAKQTVSADDPSAYLLLHLLPFIHFVCDKTN